jgi:hypothetical protein
MEDCREHLFKAEQIKRITLLEESKLASRKKEEVRRVNSEFERIVHMLTQRRLFLLDFLNLIFDKLEKKIKFNISTAVAQTAYTDIVYKKIELLYNKFFKKNSSGKPDTKCNSESNSPVNQATEDFLNVKNKKSEIITLNEDINTILPALEDEYKVLKRNFKQHNLNEIKYPSFSIDCKNTFYNLPF